MAGPHLMFHVVKGVSDDLTHYHAINVFREANEATLYTHDPTTWCGLAWHVMSYRPKDEIPTYKVVTCFRCIHEAPAEVTG